MTAEPCETFIDPPEGDDYPLICAGCGWHRYSHQVIPVGWGTVKRDAPLEVSL